MANLQPIFDNLKRNAAQLRHGRGLLLAPIFAAVYIFSWWVRFEGESLPVPRFAMFASLFPVVLVQLFVFLGVFGSHYWGRHLTFHDLGTLVKASSISSVILLIGDFLLFPEDDIPRSIFVMDWGATIVAVGAVQASLRWLRETRNDLKNRDGEPVLVVGANESGESLLRELRRNPQLKYRVHGFISNNEKAVTTRISGVPVLGTTDQTCEIAKQHGLKEVLITAGQLTGMQVRELVEKGKARGVTVRVMPGFEQLLRGSFVLPREVSIEDLLRRDPVALDQGKLKKWLNGKVILVTGSSGSIGSEICRQLTAFHPEKLVLVDRSECGQFFLERELRQSFPHQDLEICMADAGDAARMAQIFKTHEPSIVFHAAAYKHVPLMEHNRGEGVKNIILVTRNVADLANAHGCESFVMVSTDKAVNPTSVMGACKRVAELYVQSLAETSRCRFVTVRFGNVLDSAGSVVPIFREQINRGGPVTVTHEDMTRYFMMIPEASQLVIQAGTMGQGGEIFVLDMGDPVRIMDLARDMIELSGLKVGEDIEIKVVGVRPGEKLYEELHIDGEKHIATSHPKIMVAESTKMNRFEVVRGIKRLENLSHLSHGLIIDELHRLIPQLQHAEILDPVAAEQRRKRA